MYLLFVGVVKKYLCSSEADQGGIWALMPKINGVCCDWAAKGGRCMGPGGKEQASMWLREISVSGPWILALTIAAESIP